MKLTPIEKYSQKATIPLDVLELMEALDKTNFPEGFRFKLRYEIPYGFETTTFMSKDDFIGAMFDKCSTGNQYVWDVYCPPLERKFIEVFVRMEKLA